MATVKRFEDLECWQEARKLVRLIYSFTKKQAKEILKLLENVTVCDPAVGSGAFLVGMMQLIIYQVVQVIL